MKFDVRVASVDALDAVKSRNARVCPLICDHGYKIDGERCREISCRAGYEVGDDNTCEKIETKRPRQEDRKARREGAETAKTASRSAVPQPAESAITRLNNSPTCTNSRLACEQSRSKFRLSLGPCASAFARCMQSGKWNRSYEGLTRQ